MKNEDYREEATALVTVSRAASQRIIQGLSGNTPDPYYSIKFNTTTGIFESKYDEAKFRADNPTTGRVSNFGIGFINTPSKTNTDAAVKALNDNLTHLMETTPYDKTIPANIPPVKLRALYATGKSFSDAKGAPVLTADEVWNNNAAALERQIHKAAENPHPAGANLTTAVGVTSSGNSKGERNNNAGNLEDGPYARSQPGYKGSDGRFAIFDTPEQGAAAQENLLKSKYLDKGLDTVSEVILKYAPPKSKGGDNSEEAVANYIGYVAKKLGITPFTKISPDMLSMLAQAMREFETGQRG